MLTDFFDLEQRKQAKHRTQLKEILKKLRVKEKKLNRKVEREQDPQKKARLLKELDVVHAQRHKGIKTLKAL